jgi:hypothetical protein
LAQPRAPSTSRACRSLSAYERQVLRPYIHPADLEAAILHIGVVPFYLLRRFSGITRGNHIYFRPGAYDSTTAAGLALLGHELVHVGQYREGMNWLTYLWSARRGYHNSAYEFEAFAVQNKIFKDLSGHSRTSDANVGT